MAAEPASSWHPALRPNSIADIVASNHETESISPIYNNAPPQFTKSEQNDPTDAWFYEEHENEDKANAWPISEDTESAELGDPISSTPLSQHAEVAEAHAFEEPNTPEEEQKTGDDEVAWLTNGHDTDGGAVLLCEKGEHDTSAEEPEPSFQEVHAVEQFDIEALTQMHAQPKVNEAIEKKPLANISSSTMAQHSSSMSFARTVSHDISFGDDDDGEWNMSRSDIDTFGFTPTSNRTTSFPAVPLLTSGSEDCDALPLPSTQALDVMEEDEKEAEIEEADYMMQSPEGDSSASWHRHMTAPGYHAPSRSIGGEVVETSTTAEAARFEEGMPLILHHEAETEASGVRLDLFEDEEANNDNFFSQFRNDDSDSNSKALLRKSTMQVTADTDDGGALIHQGTLDDTAEEHADESAEGVALGIPGTAEPVQSSEDLTSKWEQAFGGDDDEDFLLDDSTEDKDIDAAAFLGSDDEGLLDDLLEESVPAPQMSQHRQSAASPYVPTNSALYQSTPYNATAAPARHPPAVPNSDGAIHYGQLPVSPSAEAAKAQSFVDKFKGGYASPYDLPTDLVTTTAKPRKRPSLQHNSPERAPAPPRSASMYSSVQVQPSASPMPASSAPSITARQSPLVPQLNNKASAPTLRSKGSFFEELPMASKPRPASRQSQQRVPSPGQYATGPPQHGPPPISHAVPPPAQRAVPAPSSIANQHPTPQQLFEETQNPSGVTGLVAPPKVNPYSTLQSQPSSVTPPSSSSSRYSPAPAALQGGGVPLSSRYSPAPSAGSRPNSSYGTGSSHNLSHLPRTSSPLAHFDSSGTTDGQHHDRRTSSSFEPRLNRVSSLPPTREVEEEEDEEAASPGNRSFSANHATTTDIVDSRYSPASPVCAARYTPPLPSATNGPATTLSSSKRTNSYAPQTAIAPAQASFALPPRAQTHSPSVMQSAGRKGSKSSEFDPRPSSSHGPTGHAVTTKDVQSAYAPLPRARGQSLTNLVSPTDGREHDPLERWKGAPVMSWGVGGTFVTVFPKSVPRYAMGQTAPVTVRTVGEVKVQNIKDLDPLQDHLVKFPGPLRGKSKKKDAVSWLSAGIEAMERELPDVPFHPQLSMEAKRSIERLLLWKILRVFIEHDGVLEGSPAVDKAVRHVLAPETAEAQSEGASLFTAAETTAAVTSMQADGVDSGTIGRIRLDLLKGDRETAVWTAVDKRLWGHAMIISQTVSPDLYKQVAQEFVRKEVNYPGHNNESLAALYKVLSGNFDDCVDELVPSHARAGLQLVSTDTSSGPTKDAMDGLDNWRETLTLVLSNRSKDDTRAMNALGKLLSSYGRAEAAHICFIFSRGLSVFGGLDDSKSDFVLIGSDHHRQSDQLAKGTEALQLSEVYEYGLTLVGGAAATAGAPHLAAYKLQHAVTLAEYGFRDRALQYCDTIASSITSQTRRSPYHHPILEASVDDFLARLKQAPKEASSSWISKPTMGKVSDSMWNRFNKFVSGDEDGNGLPGSDGDNGPFARISSSPNVSRPPSTSNLDVYGSPSYPSVSIPATAGTAVSQYAPAPIASFPAGNVNPYNPAMQGQRVLQPASTANGQIYAPSHYGPNYSGAPTAHAQTVGYQPAGYPGGAAGFSYQPVASTAPDTQQQLTPAAQAPISGGYQPYGLKESPDIQPQPLANNGGEQKHQPSSYDYSPLQTSPAQVANGAAEAGGSSGYQPPSFQPYGYEPPSYQPDVEDDDEPKPKKKSFMDDDEDDIPALRQSQEKSKAEKDRENEEMFRKAAEEDAKQAAAAASVKKGWGFGGWFGGGKKAEGTIGEAQPGKPIKAKLGEQSSFVYDPELKRWINKKPGAENLEAKKAAPPPPRGAPRSVSGTPPPHGLGTPPPVTGRSSVPPMPFRSTAGNLMSTQSMENLSGAAALGAPPTGLSRSVSSNNTVSAPPSTGPPSRPTTSMSNASSIDDLIGAPGPRKVGPKKGRKSGRYVDVMAK
ncbi:COPII coat assembly protein sec-16 [Metarhizium rileyi]|uniref:Protein transport protein sec16 n=1 Tax=Metarhizium rileyi (strain RCEF 4871) TaxID=1649241 RepID=A0A166XXE2_METRR|nr:COPII coat assembly protein sec-16 [Metarhizium rileyi RCEF 4871]